MAPPAFRPPGTLSDRAFLACLGLLGGAYVVLILLLLLSDFLFTTTDDIRTAFTDPGIRAAIILSLISCSVTTVLALLVAVPLGYLLARTDFWGKTAVETILDIPIVLPPLVIGLSLLILFQLPPGLWFQKYFPITYQRPSVVIAQFTVSAAFAVRTMRVTFDQIHPRAEQVALTLGCSRFQAFWLVLLPAAQRGILTAATLSWARSFGEFGPILVFSGATAFKTEVLPTSVFLELGAGNLEGAMAISLLMIVVSLGVLLLARLLGLRGAGYI